MTSQALNTSDPQSMLPDQYFSGESRMPGLDGERRLMLAVLEDAVIVVQRYALARDPEKRQECLEAREWIASRDTSWPFSFDNICNVLGIDPEYIRGGLRARSVAGRKNSLPQREIRIMPLLAQRSGSNPTLAAVTAAKELDIRIAS
jgi:hypothetical protein